MLTISGLTYRVGGRHGRALLNEANAQIPDGSKLGLVGRNGAGKSTLLDLIRGRLLPDAGDVFVPRGWRIGFLAQEAPSGEATPFDTVLAADKERAALLRELDRGPEPLRIAEIEARLDEIGARSAPARAGRILAGLGLDAAMQARPLSELSGGWRMRVALAAVLFSEPDLLLLDEPTNHLDLEAALWLERFLRRYRHTFVLVSHDRQLLNAATTATLHLENGKLTLYSGGFEKFLRARREAAARQSVLARRQQQERERLQGFVDRFRAKASKARQAQSRVKALAKLEPVALIEDAPPPVLRLPQPPELSPPLVALERASVGYEPGRPILSRLDLRLDPDDRIALLGANGNGKTTFARLLAGRLEPLSGRVTRSPKLTCGFFAQHQIEEMRLDEFGLRPSRGAAAGRAARDGARPARRVRLRPGEGAVSGRRTVGRRAGAAQPRAGHARRAVAADPRRADQPSRHGNPRGAGRGARRIQRRGRAGQPRLAPRRTGRRPAVAGRGRHGAAVRRRSRSLSPPAVVARGGRPERGNGAAGPAIRAAPPAAMRPNAASRSNRCAGSRGRPSRWRPGSRPSSSALDTKLAAPGAFGGRGPALADALKRRAELARLIAEAEAEWVAAESEIERMTQASLP